jgi:hypothetical protein
MSAKDWAISAAMARHGAINTIYEQHFSGVKFSRGRQKEVAVADMRKRLYAPLDSGSCSGGGCRECASLSLQMGTDHLSATKASRTFLPVECVCPGGYKGYLKSLITCHQLNAIELGSDQAMPSKCKLRQ